MSITKEQAMEIYNNLPFDLQYYIKKKEKRDNLHERLLAAQKNLEDNFIRSYSQSDQNDDSDFYFFQTKNGYLYKSKISKIFVDIIIFQQKKKPFCFPQHNSY